MSKQIKLYTGNECFELFKQCYYKYCRCSLLSLKTERIKTYEKMKYANDYYGIHTRTLGRLEYMHKAYSDHIDKFDTKFWFEVFIKGIGFHDYILERNGI